jgi:hypothetical protein
VSILGGGADAVRGNDKDISISKIWEEVDAPLVLPFRFGFSLKPFLGSWGVFFAPVLRAGSQLPLVEVTAMGAAPKALVRIVHWLSPRVITGSI